MRFPEKVKGILVKVRKEVKVPLTIKIRSGWDKEHINAVGISKIAEGCGVDAISLHPRTKHQGFHGRADWHLIGEVKRAVNYPCHWEWRCDHTFSGKENDGTNGVRWSDDWKRGFGESLDLLSWKYRIYRRRIYSLSLSGGEAESDRASLLVASKPLWGERGNEKDSETYCLVYQRTSFQCLLSLKIIWFERKGCVI